jgi:NADH-quinone oxidoreductase subunit G
MNEELVKIEVDGTLLAAPKGAMLIEVTDAAGIYIPRFCYHKKLSVAANCRMCLVEVERAPKPLPACATPVMDGMRVSTASAKAIAAQKSTMEFLLINHPLDCPICDQGGECELQDVAMGYGSDFSQFQERKRVVKDEDIGPLIETEMTRCIHCTRCVRFGDEIANLRELGATERGEHMKIGTYVGKTLVSELSGNVIDLCPVGALTAKPSRYTGRSWEYIQHSGVSPHDSVGSNLYLHTRNGKVMRVVPQENEAVNEVWISDRDRFSYEGLYSEDRATQPLVNGEVKEWDVAMEAASQGLMDLIEKQGADSVGVLVSPNATLEEMYLIQKLARDLGIVNLDHRLRQGDFTDQDEAPVFPWLGMPLAALESLRSVLLVGSNIRMEQPLAAHRLRKASNAAAQIMTVNPRDFDFRFPLAAKLIADPSTMVTALAGIAKAVAELQQVEIPASLRSLIGQAPIYEIHRNMAEKLVKTQPSAVLLGNLAVAHPAFSQLRALASFVAQISEAALGYLPEAANSAGGWLAGVLPHRLAGGKPASVTGLDARAMLESPRKAYILVGIEPEFDCWDSATALTAVQDAEFVVTLTAYASETTKAYTNVLLPIAAFAETSGSYVNAEGRCQSFPGAAKPFGESRPAWKVLRVLGNALQLPGFNYMTSQEVLEDVLDACKAVEPYNLIQSSGKFSNFISGELLRVGDVPIYAVDATVRRANALQQSVWAQPASVHVNPEVARQLGLENAIQAAVRQNGEVAILPLVLDNSIPQGCVWIPAGLKDSISLGPSIGPVALSEIR